VSDATAWKVLLLLSLLLLLSPLIAWGLYMKYSGWRERRRKVDRDRRRFLDELRKGKM
jgi:hypothetical protein